MSKGFMYILKCSDDSYYVGSTRCIETRLNQHRSGLGSAYTYWRLPVSLIYYEEFRHVSLAFNREKQVQGWSRQKKEALILRDPSNLKFSSECKNVSHYKLRRFDDS